MKKLLLILISVIFFSGVYSQELFKGKVTIEEHGHSEPLVGANVVWLGTTKGTITDTRGNFEIESPGHEAHYLVVSFIGYEPDTVHVHDHDSEIQVRLGGSEHLEEVEVAHRKSGSHLSRKEPIHTHIVTSEELCKAACCNLSESFETNASVDVSFADAATGVKRIQMLGLNGLYVQTMTENNPNFRGLANNYGLEYIPGTWMSSIQISKGAASVINGYESLTGQINIELKKPDTDEKGFVNLFANSFGRMEANAGVALKLNDAWSTSVMGHGSLLAIEWDENNDNFLDDPLIQRYSFLNRWKYEKDHFNTQFGLTVLEENRIGGQLSHDPDAPLTTANGFGININTRRMDGFLKSGYIFKHNEDASIALVSNYTMHEHNSYYGLRNYDADQNNIHTNVIFQSTIAEHHMYSAGVSFNYNNLNEVYLDTTFSMNEKVPGVFGQYTFNLDEKLVILAGLRADHHSDFGLFFTPRMHIKYDVLDNFTLRSSAGKAYRTPYLIAENSYLLSSGRRLVFEDKPAMEEAWNYGLSLTKYFEINHNELSAIVDFYRTQFQEQLIVDIDTDPTAVYFRNLAGKSFSNNYQAELKYTPIRNLEINLAYRYSDVKFTLQDQLVEKALVNRYKGLLSMSYQTAEKSWQFDYNVQVNGDGRLPGLQDEIKRYPAYALMSGQITKYFKQLDIYGGVENLTGYVQENPVINAENPFSDTFDATQVWGPIHGRRFYVGLRYRFE